MTDFAFRSPGNPAMHSPAKLKKASSGLWSGEMGHPSGTVRTLGHLDKSNAKASMDTIALKKYGRVPVYIHEDD